MKFKTIFLSLLGFASAVFSADEREWSTEPYGSRMCLLSRSGIPLTSTYSDPVEEFGVCISELERLCISAEKIDNAVDSRAVEELKTTTLKSVKATVKKMAPLIQGISRMGCPDTKIKNLEKEYEKYMTQVPSMIDSKLFEASIQSLIWSAKEIKRAV